MSDPQNHDPTIEDEYDEEEDSDFDENVASSSGEESDKGPAASTQPAKRRKTGQKPQAGDEDGILDSGDEATILERKKDRRRKKKKGEDVEDESDREEQGWKAKTRAMRQTEKSENNRRKLSSTRGSTLDVDSIFQQMQASNDQCDEAYLQALQYSKDSRPVNAVRATVQEEAIPAIKQPNTQSIDPLDSITIKQTYRFAGELHVEEKVVSRSSDEGRAWLAQHSEGAAMTATADGAPLTKTGQPLRRPLRKMSRFDPNLNNPDSFKKNWEKTMLQLKDPAGPKINTVEKSRLDWVDHVSRAGLKDELSEHAKAKGSYLHQRDFLDRVEQSREEDAKRARLQT
ncbi:MAG: hypothetical protein Q9160_002691 [Pyrenula sp. 1 TL-2023]